jgi:hypothetical protein
MGNGEGSGMKVWNQCSACGADFTSVELFDRHRVGTHEYLFAPERPDGRRCLTVEEMTGRGWEQNDRGRWLDPARAERARARFAEAA